MAEELQPFLTGEPKEKYESKEEKKKKETLINDNSCILY